MFTGRLLGATSSTERPLMRISPLVGVRNPAIMRMIGIASLADALSLGLVIGVGYLLAMCMTIAINPNFPRPFFYTMVNAPYFLISSLMTTALLFLLQ